MEPICVLAYFALIVGVGSGFVKRLPLEPELHFITSLVAGSCCLGIVFVGLALTGNVTPLLVAGVVALSLLATLINARFLTAVTAAFFLKLYHYLFSQRKLVLLTSLVFVLFILWYIFLAWAPPRHADAMKYHLAQLDDIVRQHGLIFRPYLHYNFSLYFSILFIPVYLATGGVGMQMAHLGYFLLSTALILFIASRYHLPHPHLLLALIFLTPISFHDATQVFNDWAMLCYLLAAFALLARSSPEEPVSTTRLVLAFLAWGFALGVKYHAVLFAPWLLILTWDRVPALSLPRRIAIMVGLLGLAGLMVSPFLLRNLFNTGNPIFPLLGKLFPVKHTYLNLVAQGFVRKAAGSHSLTSLWMSFKDLALLPDIPATLWLLGVAGWLVDHQTDLRLKLGPFLFLLLWWLLQPHFLPRFAIFLLPFAWLSIPILWEWTMAAGRFLIRVCVVGLVLITLTYGLAVGFLYSGDYALYHLSRDKVHFHRATWFWQDYQWLNTHLPQQAKVLVIVSAGQTFYLERDYLRGDPCLSGLIDWRQITTPKELLRRLNALGINYIFYENRDWTGCPGGENVNRLLKELPAYEGVEILWTRTTRLFFSRILDHSLPTRVVLLKISPRALSP